MTGSLALGHLATYHAKQGLVIRPGEVDTMRPPLAHISVILVNTVTQSDLLLRCMVMSSQPVSRPYANGQNWLGWAVLHLHCLCLSGAPRCHPSISKMKMTGN